VSRPSSWVGLAALLVPVAVSCPAAAQANYRSTPTGGRSALMGNTGVVFARDGSAPYLNPATIAAIDESSVAFSVNFYSYAHSRYSAWHQPGPVDAKQFGALSLGNTYNTQDAFDALPSTVCLFFTIGKWSGPLPQEKAPLDKPRRRRQKLALCLGTVERDSTSFPAVNYGSTAGGVSSEQSQSFLRNWSRFQAGPSWSGNLTDKLALGVSLHGIYTTYSVSWTSNNITLGPGDKAISSGLDSDVDARSFDLAAVAGLTYRLGKGLALGLSAQSPSAHVVSYLNGSLRSQFSGPTDYVQLENGNGSFSAPSPFRIALGFGAETARLKIEVNQTLFVPQGSSLSANVQEDTVTVANGASSSVPGVASFRERTGAVVDSAVGLEYFLTPTLSVLGGMSTDFSASPPLPATIQPSLGTFYQERMQRALVSLGVGSYGDATELLLGTQLGYGWGKALAVDGFVLPNEFATVNKSIYSAIFIIGGNVSLDALQRTLVKMQHLVIPGPRAPQ